MRERSSRPRIILETLFVVLLIRERRYVLSCDLPAIKLSPPDKPIPCRRTHGSPNPVHPRSRKPTARAGISFDRATPECPQAVPPPHWARRVKNDPHSHELVALPEHEQIPAQRLLTAQHPRLSG